MSLTCTNSTIKLLREHGKPPMSTVSQAKLGQTAVITLDELERIKRDLFAPNEKHETIKHLRQTKEELKQLSLAKQKNWSNTI